MLKVVTQVQALEEDAMDQEVLLPLMEVQFLLLVDIVVLVLVEGVEEMKSEMYLVDLLQLMAE